MIWIVEDNVLDQQIYKMIFAPGTVRYFATGEQAGHALHDQGCQDIELLVTDQRLPGMLGLDLVASLRALPGGSEVPVCVVASKLSDKDRDAAIRLEVRGIWEKPNTMHGWRAIIAVLGAHRRKHD